MKKKFFVITLLFLVSFVCFAEGYYGRDIPDSSEIREKIIDKWFTQDLKILRFLDSEIYENSIGQKFQVRMEELDDSFAIVVAPSTLIEMDLVSETEIKSTVMEIYPYDLPGSWILFRDKKTGNPISVRYYFHKNSEIYVEFDAEEVPSMNASMKKKKNDEKIYGSFLIFGMYLAHSVPVGLTIDNLYSFSFTQMVEVTKTSLPWEYADVNTLLYDDSLQMIGCIREKLPGFVFEKDACYDGEMRPIKISTGELREEKAEKGGVSLDSFGFVKWVVDGLVRPISGSNLELNPLKTPTVKLRTGSKADFFADKYNQYFALDWIRNIAAAYLSILSNNFYTYENSGCEVQIRPFASQFTKNGTKNIPVYIKDNGYSIESLKALFYIFAIQEPGRFYLAAMRETDNSVPQNVFYARAAVLFPYFDANGDYNVSIFENGKEYTIDEFIEKNPGTFVNLVRMQSSQRFFPQ